VPFLFCWQFKFGDKSVFEWLHLLVGLVFTHV
jgi:hypothetical protein